MLKVLHRHHSSSLTRARSMPSSISTRGTSATIVSGPQTKQSVAASSMRGASCDGLMRTALAVPRFGRFARHVQAQVEAVVRGHLAELGQVGEVVGRLGAVEQPHPAFLSPEQRLSDHRPDRRDARTAGDEQEVALRRLDREDERAERALNSQLHAGRDRVELVSPAAGGLDLDQEVEPAVLERLDRRRGDRVGDPGVVIRGSDECRLAGFEGERRAAQIEPHDSCRRCRRDDGLDGEDESVGRQG